MVKLKNNITKPINKKNLFNFLKRDKKWLISIQSFFVGCMIFLFFMHQVGSYFQKQRGNKIKDSFLEKAQNYKLQGDYSHSLIYYKKTARFFPADSIVREKIANLYEQQNRFQDAQWEYQIGLLNDPSLSIYYSSLLEKREEWKKIIAWYKKSPPKTSYEQALLIKSWFKIGKIKTGQSIFPEKVDDPELIILQALGAIAYDKELSQELFYNIDPDLYSFPLLLKKIKYLILEEKGLYHSKGKKEISRILNQLGYEHLTVNLWTPFYILGEENLLQALINTGHWEKTNKLLLEKTDPKKISFADYLFLTGKLLEKSRPGRTNIPYLRLVDNYYIDSKQGKELARFFKNRNQEKKAFQTWQKIIQANPLNVTAWDQVISYLVLEQKNLNEALNLAQLAQTFLPDSAKINNLLGWIYLEMGNEKQAEEIFKQTLTLNPIYAPCYYNLGRIYLQRKQMTKAQQALEKSIHWDYQGSIAKLAIDLYVENY